MGTTEVLQETEFSYPPARDRIPTSPTPIPVGVRFNVIIWDTWNKKYKCRRGSSDVWILVSGASTRNSVAVRMESLEIAI